MLPMHLQSSEVAVSNSFNLRRCNNKKMHYLTLDLDLRVTHNISQYLLHHVTFEPSKFAVGTSNGLGDMFTENISKYSLHHVAYAPAKFKVALSNHLEVDAKTRKSII